MSECDKIFTDMLHVPWHGHAKDIHLVGFMGLSLMRGSCLGGTLLQG